MSATQFPHRFRWPPTPLSAPVHLAVFSIRLRRTVTDSAAGCLTGNRRVSFAEDI